MKEKKHHNTHDGNESNLDPVLKNLLKDNPFSVPDQFFTDQRKQILHKTVLQNAGSKTRKERTFLLKPVLLWSVASVAAVVLLFVMLFYNGESYPSEDYFSGISMEQVLEENPGYLYMLDEDSFYDALSITSSDLNSSSIAAELFLDTLTSRESIQEYLIEEEVSLDMLNL